jgi:ABC-type transport system involved in multi-copper enzyme maturation permease subunit
LWILGLTAWQATVGWTRSATLGDTSRFGLMFFQIVAVVQLFGLLFFAALSGASSISYEKDRRTFVLLLLTDLRNSEIVVGKLLGSLLQILLLLLASAPLLAMIVLLGGVGLAQVGETLLVLAATGVAAGSLGVLVALWRDRTFQSLALTVLLLVLYLFLVRALSVLPLLLSIPTWLGGNAIVPLVQRSLDPLLAMQSVLTPPGSEDALATLPPALGYTGAMVLLSVLLNFWGIFKLRVWNPSGEPIMQREAPGAEGQSAEAEEKDRARAHAAPGKARAVWTNPILWREIRTRAYGRRPLLVKTAYFLVLGLICYSALMPVINGETQAGFAAAFGLVPVGILSLLLVAAQAVTAVTSERDTGALDLLLVTDLSPQEFIFGKILSTACWRPRRGRIRNCWGCGTPNHGRASRA